MQNYYTFSLWIYKQNENTKKTILYGVIVPQSETIPQTGWNFKRAARVALLIGADGGVYNKDIDPNNVNGALGTWRIDVRNAPDRTKLGLPAAGANYYHTYVAMTGMDIFTPEYELPEGNVNLKKDWDLATRKLGAWNYFSAGGTQGAGGCYVINHEGTETTGTPTVKNDEFRALSASCQPLFFVDQTANGGTGKVFVNHDLEVGKINGATATPNVTITQEGVIKQVDGLTIDADGRIIAKDKVTTGVGEISNSDPYVIDPKYTSVMGDIRLVSRGGVRLSDILPNYILKETSHKTCTISGGSCTISAAATTPTCPNGYTVAYLVTPTTYKTADFTKKTSVSVSTESSDNFLKSGSDVLVQKVKDTAGVISDDGSVSVVSSASSSKVQSTGKLKSGGTEFTDVVSNVAPLTLTGEMDGKTYKITFSGSNGTTVGARVDSYCVYDGTDRSTEMDQPTCEGAGFTWDNTNSSGKHPHCRYVYNLSNINNKITDPTKKAAACKAAGKSWNGTNCS